MHFYIMDVIVWGGRARWEGGNGWSHRKAHLSKHSLFFAHPWTNSSCNTLNEAKWGQAQVRVLCRSASPFSEASPGNLLIYIVYNLCSEVVTYLCAECKHTHTQSFLYTFHEKYLPNTLHNSRYKMGKPRFKREKLNVAKKVWYVIFSSFDHNLQSL